MKEKNSVESKAKSVGQLNDDEEHLGNKESIELTFISDEFVNKVQKQEQKMIILDDKMNIKRRDSLNNKQKIVIITDEYKKKVLRNNSILVATENSPSRSRKRRRRPSAQTPTRICNTTSPATTRWKARKSTLRINIY